MLRLLVFVAFVLLFANNSASSQTTWLSNNARQLGVGNSGASLIGARGMSTNPASFANIQSFALSSSFSNYYLIEGLNTFSLATFFKVSELACSIQLDQFGDDVYSTGGVGASVAHQARFASIGLSGKLCQTNVAEIGTNYAFTFDLGAIFKVSEWLYFGMSAQGLSFTKDKPTMAVGAPIYNIGCKIGQGSALSIYVAYRTDIALLKSWPIGLEYKFVDKISLRTATDILNDTYYIGLGFEFGAFALDLAVSYGMKLGTVQNLSVYYEKP